MKVNRFWTVAAAHRGRLLAIPAILALLALGSSFAITPTYVASTTLKITDADPAAVTEVAAILGSRELAQTVNARLHLEDRPTPGGTDGIRSAVTAGLNSVWTIAGYGYVAEKPTQDAALDRVRRALTFTVEPGGAYIHVAASADDSVLAAALANEAVDALLARAQALLTTSATERIGLLESQLADAKARADSARDAVLAYSLKTNIVPNESVRAAVATADRAAAAVRDLDLALSDARARQNEVDRQLAVTPSETTTTTTQGDVRTTTTAPNPVYLTLRDRANTIRQEIAALQTRRAAADAKAASSLDDLRTLMTQDSRLAALTQEQTVADEKYLNVSKDLASARSDAARLVMPVQQVDRAVAPDYPVSPVRMGFLAVGVALGVLIALATLLLLAATDRTLLTPTEVVAVLGDVPLLAVVARNPRGGRPGLVATGRSSRG